MDDCFRLVEFTSSADYKRSRGGWKPKAKRKEMRLLDLKYLLVKHEDHIEGFCSFMPTEEDEYFVIYCYEIHLAPSLQGYVLEQLPKNLTLTSTAPV
jgi:N-alpha-acetyltransferase 40